MSPSRIAEAAFDRLRELGPLDRLDAVKTLLETDWADGGDVEAARRCFVEIMVNDRNVKVEPMPATIPFRGR